MNKKPTLLYVEDEEGIRNELSRFLKHFSSELYVASDGEKGLELFIKYSPDIVISDIKMPNMDGIEMVKIIKKLNPRQYVLFTTAHSESSYFIEAIEMQINGLILKPIDLDILADKLEIISEQIDTKNTKELYEGYMLQQSRLAQIGEMISMLAHQWRQPLSTMSAISTTMQLSLELEQFDTTQESQRKEQEKFFIQELGNLDSNLKSLSEIIDNFSNFYKSDEKVIKLKLEDVISSALQMIDTLLKNDNINLIVEYNSDTEVEVYSHELSQAIVNILKNAQDNFLLLKTKNPIIKIVVDEYNVKIYDNGGGIQEEILSKIFDPYFSTKGEKNGKGLGLYMAKIIIEKHHKGKLSVTNTDNGVCFNIELVDKI